MFQCPYKQCVRTFTRRAALREHLKTHEGEVYWEMLNNTSNINRIITEQQQERNVIIIKNDERDVDNNEEIDNNEEVDIMNEDEIIDIINEGVINEDEEIDINEDEE